MVTTANKYRLDPASCMGVSSLIILLYEVPIDN